MNKKRVFVGNSILAWYAYIIIFVFPVPEIVAYLGYGIYVFVCEGYPDGAVVFGFLIFAIVYGSYCTFGVGGFSYVSFKKENLFVFPEMTIFNRLQKYINVNYKDLALMTYCIKDYTSVHRMEPRYIFLMAKDGTEYWIFIQPFSRRTWKEIENEIRKRCPSIQIEMTAEEFWDKMHPGDKKKK